MGKDKPKQDAEAPTTIVSNDTVILNSVGPVHVGSGTQVNIIAIPKKKQ